MEEFHAVTLLRVAAATDALPERHRRRLLAGCSTPRMQRRIRRAWIGLGPWGPDHNEPREPLPPCDLNPYLKTIRRMVAQRGGAHTG